MTHGIGVWVSARRPDIIRRGAGGMDDDWCIKEGRAGGPVTVGL